MTEIVLPKPPQCKFSELEDNALFMWHEQLFQKHQVTDGLNAWNITNASPDRFSDDRPITPVKRIIVQIE